jgi:hypothetical protein
MKKAVKVIQAVQNFINFFAVKNKNERCYVFSGTLAPNKVENNLLGADKTGQSFTAFRLSAVVTFLCATRYASTKFITSFAFMYPYLQIFLAVSEYLVSQY